MTIDAGLAGFFSKLRFDLAKVHEVLRYEGKHLRSSHPVNN
jgi:hypothetical protein